MLGGGGVDGGMKSCYCLVNVGSNCQLLHDISKYMCVQLFTGQLAQDCWKLVSAIPKSFQKGVRQGMQK